MSRVQRLGESIVRRVGVGLFDQTDPECTESAANTAACTALCVAIGAGLPPAVSGCVVACLAESCGQGYIIPGPELKKGLPSVVPGGVSRSDFTSKAEAEAWAKKRCHSFYEVGRVVVR